MIKIIGFILANATALLLSSVSLVSTSAMLGESLSISFFLKLGVYSLFLIVAFLFYRFGKKMFSA